MVKGNEGEGQVLEEVEEQDSFGPKTPSKDGIEEILRPRALGTRASTTSAPDDPFSAVNVPKNPLHPTPTSPPPMPFAPSPSTTPRTTHNKYFQITIDRSRIIHQDFVERQPFWKQFNPMKSMAQDDLSKKVPHLGLSDVSKRPPNAHRTPNKVLKQMNYYTEKRMPSLLDMWEEGGREKKVGDRSP
jgi:hypothetical protein